MSSRNNNGEMIYFITLDAIPEWAEATLIDENEDYGLSDEELEQIKGFKEEYDISELADTYSRDGFSWYPRFGLACDTFTGIFTTNNPVHRQTRFFKSGGRI